jgi:hypothetical protein
MKYNYLPGCVNAILENMGMYETVKPANAESEIECCVRCERYKENSFFDFWRQISNVTDRLCRQSNQLLRSEHIFPNRMFARQKKFWWIVHQLFLTCNPDQAS